MSSHRQTTATAIATVLAAISLYPLFSGTTWFWVGAGATITVAAVGTLTRLRRLPALVCLAAGTLGLVLYLNLVFEARFSLGHVLPTLTSLNHLGRLARTGMSESARYAPPAPELSGLVLLGSGGIGIVALLTDLTAVRLRSVALAGIPLLLLITEPFTVSASRTWVGTVIAFCLGSAGYLGMLGTESRQRIREWEQPRPSATGGPDTSALSAAGRRVGLTSLVVALCLPLLIPGLHTTRLLGGQPGIGGHPGSGGGGGAVGFPSPETVLSQELQTAKPQAVLQYRDAGSADLTAPQYLQLYSLDQLTDAGWQLVSTPAQDLPSSGRLPLPPGLASGPLGLLKRTTPGPGVQVGGGTTVVTSVTMAPNVNAQAGVNGKTISVLPVPYPALAVVPPPGVWQASTTDLMVYSTDAQGSGQTYTAQGSGLTYTVESLDEQPPTSDLEAAGPPPADIRRTYASLPASYRQWARPCAPWPKGSRPGSRPPSTKQWPSSPGSAGPAASATRSRPRPLAPRRS